MFYEILSRIVIFLIESATIANISSLNLNKKIFLNTKNPIKIKSNKNLITSKNLNNNNKKLLRKTKIKSSNI